MIPGDEEPNEPLAVAKVLVTIGRARREKARRGELIVSAPIGYIKSEDQRLEKDPDLRVQQAILLVFRKFTELDTVRQTVLDQPCRARSVWMVPEGY